MKQRIDCVWDEGMSFKTEVNEHALTIDAHEMVGGENKGPRPKPLMLVALGGCTGMDVVSILKKMRVEPDYFNVSVEGELTDQHPKVYSKIHVTYIFKGEDLPMEKLEKAVNLSQDNYCGVSAMLKEACDLTHEIIIED